jgi:hypothetical protein
LLLLQLHIPTVILRGRAVLRRQILVLLQFHLAVIHHWLLYPAVKAELAVKCPPLHLFPLDLHSLTVVGDGTVIHRQILQFRLAIHWLLYPAIKAELAVKCPPLQSFPLDLHSLTVIGDGTVIHRQILQFRLAIHWLLYPAIKAELAVKCPPLQSFPLGLHSLTVVGDGTVMHPQILQFRLPIHWLLYPAIKAELAVNCPPLHLFRLPIIQVLSLTPPGHRYKGGLVHDFHLFRRILQGLLHESLLMMRKHVRHLPFI